MREINIKVDNKDKKPRVINPKFVQIFKFIILLSLLYLILAPFLPEINYQIRNFLGIPYREEIIFSDKSKEEDESEGDRINRRQSRLNDFDLSENRLIIPTIGVHIGIVEGDDESVLYRGAWRRPNTGTPEIGGNTVITGHRFHYIPPNNKTFYNLNKLEIGSKVFVFWNEVEYVYQVYDKFVVEPEQIEIEKHIEGNILTLYTCHPLWTADQRLVVRAKFLEINEH